MEIEKKFLINLPLIDIKAFPCVNIEQGYICTNPVIRIRKKENSHFITYKSSGLMIRQEYEDEISKEQYDYLKKKIDYNLIIKERYYIPVTNSLTAEVDVFKDKLEGLIMAEVEFPSEEIANNFTPPNWFITEVTFNSKFHNSNLCKEEDISFLNNI
ncbi:MAG: CYTH domain-containing protein [Vallitalea sp.]|jgi:CYTH domain-containing protein|nr:CYTH domain-containing protein [Vallitalea sp.]